MTGVSSGSSEDSFATEDDPSVLLSPAADDYLPVSAAPQPARAEAIIDVAMSNATNFLFIIIPLLILYFQHFRVWLTF